MNMLSILMMSSKLAILDFLKTMFFWNKVYDIIISVFDVNNENFLCHLNYTVDVAMWPKLVTLSFLWEKLL